MTTKEVLKAFAQVFELPNKQELFDEFLKLTDSEQFRIITLGTALGSCRQDLMSETIKLKKMADGDVKVTNLDC